VEYVEEDEESEAEESDHVVHQELLDELDNPEKDDEIFECAISLPGPKSKPSAPETGDTVIDGVYYPGEGVFFRLCSSKTGYCIYARDHRSPAHGGHYLSRPHNDQFFQLTYDKERSNWALRNRETEKYLEAGAGDNDYVGHTTTPGDKT
jgi:hypothetical protein